MVCNGYELIAGNFEKTGFVFFNRLIFNGSYSFMCGKTYFCKWKEQTEKIL